MGVQVSVVNNTPYAWRIGTQDRITYDKGYKEVKPNSTITFEQSRGIHRYLYLHYGHDHHYFSFEYNTFKGDTTFTLKETLDRTKVEIYCSSEDSTRHFPNYAHHHYS